MSRARAAGALIAAVVVIFGAVALGARLPGVRQLPGLSAHTSDGYARDAIGSIAPLDAAYVERRIGADALRRITGEATPTGDEATRPPTKPGRQPAIQGKRGLVPGLAPGGWALTVDMVADRQTVSSGDEIEYRMTIRNVGTEDFRGRNFELEWHTPSGTFGRNPATQCNLVPTALLKAVCRSQRLAISRGDDDAHERVNSAGFIPIAAGQEWEQRWYVHVLPTATADTRYVTHAHLTVIVDGREQTLTTAPVVVTVAA